MPVSQGCYGTLLPISQGRYGTLLPVSQGRYGTLLPVSQGHYGTLLPHFQSHRGLGFSTKSAISELKGGSNEFFTYILVLSKAIFIIYQKNLFGDRVPLSTNCLFSWPNSKAVVKLNFANIFSVHVTEYKRCSPQGSPTSDGAHSYV